jgi:hypothetical protein
MRLSHSHSPTDAVDPTILTRLTVVHRGTTAHTANRHITSELIGHSDAERVQEKLDTATQVKLSASLKGAAEVEDGKGEDRQDALSLFYGMRQDSAICLLASDLPALSNLLALIS